MGVLIAVTVCLLVARKMVAALCSEVPAGSEEEIGGEGKSHPASS